MNIEDIAERLARIEGGIDSLRSSGKLWLTTLGILLGLIGSLFLYAYNGDKEQIRSHFAVNDNHFITVDTRLDSHQKELGNMQLHEGHQDDQIITLYKMLENRK